MQWAWYRWPHGSWDAADASWRASVQTAQAAAASETVTLASAPTDSRDDDPPRRWSDTKEVYMEDAGSRGGHCSRPPVCGGVSGLVEMK
uniref:Uncharacterized protein n=1 Tax=Oryza punctata TaxID=4537 RepID=A0A0E0M1U7_ORYPU